MNLMEKTLKKNYVYKGKIVKVRADDAETQTGKKVLREVVEHPGGVCVAALTEQDELLFVRQYRYPYGTAVLELPAGKLEPGEDPFEAMKREQREETGTRADRYVDLGELYPSPGYADEVLRLWACRVSAYGDTSPDEDEFLEIIRIPLAEAVQMALRNELPDAKTQVGVLKVSLLAEAGRL